MKAFIGTFVNKIDAKGRISVPASFRGVVQAKSLTGVALYASPVESCVEGCGMDRIDSLVEAMPDRFDQVSGTDEVAEAILAAAREAAFDADGRIILPEDLIAHAGLRDRGAFVGKGRVFQIWEPDTLAAMNDARLRRIAAAQKAVPPARPAQPNKDPAR
ncbi:MAG: division/cell wall cluster transcriptional repressor MraZ [Rhodospirillaceae bacterium]|nr:division/cell wall cluster transcriptional repressor MraZ [Rhodospirillaceae bacterium]